MNGTQAKVSLFVAIFKFKVVLLDQVTQTVQTRLRSDRDYNTTIGSVRGYSLVSGDDFSDRLLVSTSSPLAQQDLVVQRFFFLPNGLLWSGQSVPSYAYHKWVSVREQMLQHQLLQVWQQFEAW